MTTDPITEFLDGVTPGVRAVAERLILIVTSHNPFDVAIKWRQLTFAVDRDFDHWVCAVSAAKQGVNLTFHFGSMLRDSANAFAPSDSKYVRKIGYAKVADVDDDAVRDLLARALNTLPQFRAEARRHAPDASDRLSR